MSFLYNTSFLYNLDKFPSVSEICSDVLSADRDKVLWNIGIELTVGTADVHDETYPVSFYGECICSNDEIIINENSIKCYIDATLTDEIIPVDVNDEYMRCYRKYLLDKSKDYVVNKIVKQGFEWFKENEPEAAAKIYSFDQFVDEYMHDPEWTGKYFASTVMQRLAVCDESYKDMLPEHEKASNAMLNNLFWNGFDSQKYADTKISITITADDIERLGIGKALNECKNEEEAYDYIYNHICSMISDYAKLGELGLLKRDGCVDFSQLVPDEQTQLREEAYREGVTGRLVDCLTTAALKLEENIDFKDTSVFDFEHYFAQLPYQDMDEHLKDFIDPERKLLTGEYNDVYLNIYNNFTDTQMAIFIVSDDKENTLSLSKAQRERFYNSFAYKIEGYDKDSGTYYLCGFANDLKTAKTIAEAAYNAEQSRTDMNRESRGVPDIDTVLATETNTDKIIGSVNRHGKFEMLEGPER